MGPEPSPLDARAIREGLLAYARTVPESFAGEWIQATTTGPRLVAAFVGDLSAHRSRLHPSIELREAVHTLAALKTVRDAVSAALGFARLGEPLQPISPWLRAAVIPERNTVVVTAFGPSRQELRRALGSGWGTAVELDYLGSEPYEKRAVALSGWVGDRRDSSFTLHWEQSVGTPQVQATEGLDEIRVKVTQRVYLGGAVALVTKAGSSRVELGAPIGSRDVVDEATRVAVPQRAPDGGDASAISRVDPGRRVRRPW